MKESEFMASVVRMPLSNANSDYPGKGTPCRLPVNGACGDEENPTDFLALMP